MHDAARQPWLAATGSCHEVESCSSSASLLHSIYGSQVSQLPFSDYSSEMGERRSQIELNLAVRSSKSATSLNGRTCSRPKSSPARVLAAREQLRRKISSTSSEDTLVVSQTSIQSGGKSEVPQGGRLVGRTRRPIRPGSATVSVRRRPPSASAYQRSRPKTALGVVSC